MKENYSAAWKLSPRNIYKPLGIQRIVAKRNPKQPEYIQSTLVSVLPGANDDGDGRASALAPVVRIPVLC